MKLLLVLALLVMPSAAKERPWVTALVESSSREIYNGGGAAVQYASPNDNSYRESIYLDAGEWLYHVTQIVTLRGSLRLRDGARVEVAEEGKKLVIRVGGKEHKLNIEQRSRGKKGAVIR